MTTYNSIECSLASGIELVKCQSGRWLSLSRNDIAIFIADATKALQSFILKGETVGLFLDMDNAQFISLVLYRACILCGANVIRCGVSDFERQLPVKNGIYIDWLISTGSVYRYIENRIKYRNHIVIKHSAVSEFFGIAESEPIIYELYDMPGFVILSNKGISCPGYNIVKSDEATVLRKKSCVENEEILEISLGIIKESCKSKEEEGELITNFIKLHVNKIVKENLNGKINDDQSIDLSSIGQIELLVKIEEEFGISFDIEDISIEKFEHVDRLTKLIFITLLEN